jgi:L-amino acid N-acyltransferase YncA
MHSDWFNRIEIFQGRWQHGGKVGYCYPSGLEAAMTTRNLEPDQWRNREEWHSVSRRQRQLLKIPDRYKEYLKILKF